MNNTLDISTIYEFVNANAASNCVKQAEAILSSNRLIMCGIKNRSKASVELIGSCRRTSEPKEKPHQISGVLFKENKVWKIKHISCSCKAGTGHSCKHCVAVLLFCHEHEICKLETLSVTDVECHWKKAKAHYLAVEKPIPIQDYCHVKPKPEHKLQESDKKRIRREIFDLLPESALGRHKRRFLLPEEKTNDSSIIKNVKDKCIDLASLIEVVFDKKCLPNFDCSLADFDAELINYYSRNVSVTKDEAKQLALETVSQSSSRWTEERKKRITGSICYEILTYTQNKNADWEQKVKRLYFSSFQGNSCTSYGLEQENEARMKYAELSGVNVVKSGLIVHPDYPFLGFSPDGIVVDQESNFKLLEIKCPIQGITKPATEVVQYLPYLEVDHESKFSLKKRHKFYGQIQLGLFLLGLAECDLIIFSSFNKTFFKVIVQKDEAFIRKLIPCLRDVYFKHILKTLSSS